MHVAPRIFSMAVSGWHNLYQADKRFFLSSLLAIFDDSKGKRLSSVLQHASIHNPPTGFHPEDESRTIRRLQKERSKLSFV